MQMPDMEAFKQIPGYKVILRAVLKCQIQALVEQLSSQTGEESVLVTASLEDGSLTHLGSDFGKEFLENHDEFKSKFLCFCVERHQVYQQSQTSLSENLTIRKKGQNSGGKGPNSGGKRPRLAPYSISRPSKTQPLQQTAESNPSYELPFENKPSFSQTSQNDQNDPSFGSGLESDQALGQNQQQHDEQKAVLEEPQMKGPERADSAEDVIYAIIKSEPGLEDDQMEESDNGSNADATTTAGAADDDDTGASGSGVQDKTFSMSADKPYVCHQCAKVFSSKTTLIQHERRHAGVAPYQCCGKQFFSAANMTRHLCSQHGALKTHICDTCGKCFATKTDLERHKRRENKTMALKCDLCGFTEESASRLREHMAKHSDEKLHRCKECGKTFKYRCGLSRHVAKKHKQQ